LPGWDYAYHVVNIKFDNEAFARYMDKLNSDIARQGVKERDPIVAKAQTVDELKEEADNADKHYWCVARDTVFVYDNTIESMEMKPNFVVCDDKAQLIGEDPGTAAGANASGVWTIKTNTQSVKFDDGEQSTKSVANVHGLPPGETQFNWHITRWGCEYNKDVFVYYNKVESKAGNDIYTCIDEANLEGVNPSNNSFNQYWRTTEFTPSTVVIEEPNKNNTKVTGLQQGDNPFVWVVEKPMPPNEEQQDGQGNTVKVNTMMIDGREYKYNQEACPHEDETIVHDLRPDEAVIQTGNKVGP